MDKSSTIVRLIASCVAVATLIVTFMLGVRPWYLHWGASGREVQRSLVGDDFLSAARIEGQTTRAIAIRAPSEDVWPWLVQLGQDRAGFYSYELLEDLVGCEMPRTDRIHPEFQERKVGDKLWMYPPEKWGGQGHALLVRYEPGHAMVFATRQVGTAATEPYDGTWSFVLERVDAESSRLIVRGRASGARSGLASAFDRLFFEPVHFIMERKMMESIKEHAEGGRGSMLRDNLQVLSWLIACILAVVAVTRVFRSASWGRPLFGFLAACFALQALMFLQPSPLWGFALLLGVHTVLDDGWLRSFRRGSPSAHMRVQQ